jgi:hypothetical protein
LRRQESAEFSGFKQYFLLLLHDLETEKWNLQYEPSVTNSLSWVPVHVKTIKDQLVCHKSDGSTCGLLIHSVYVPYISILLAVNMHYWWNFIFSRWYYVFTCHVIWHHIILLQVYRVTVKVIQR